MVKRTNILKNASFIDEKVKNIEYDFWKIESNEILPKIDNNTIKTISSKKFLDKFNNYSSCIDDDFTIISEKGIKELIKLVKNYENKYLYWIIEDEDVGYSNVYTIILKSLLDKVVVQIDIMDCCNHLDTQQIFFEYKKN